MIAACYHSIDFDSHRLIITIMKTSDIKEPVVFARIPANDYAKLKAMAEQSCSTIRAILVRLIREAKQ